MADLWARDRADVTLRMYPGTSGLLGTPVTIPGSFTVTNRALLTSAGDADRDGHPDLWSTIPGGTADDLAFRPGTDTGPGTPVTVGVGGRQWMLHLA
ncbi:hypothetical protein GCM10020367_24450 [Streptomyces sannanensis]|uniref:VCBS repeat-containing protein n=1 Tax=Streptomyces sannanensis TaxID=285536 RepID=A0ABP6SAK4_9ACTN